MKTLILLGTIFISIGCFSNKRNTLYPLGKQDILLFLNSEEWALKEICVDGNCNTITNNEDYAFGIETIDPRPNFCTDEKGDFYTIGKYILLIDPVTFEYQKVILSCPDYFKISEFGKDNNVLKIKLCTPTDYYSGELIIKNEFTIEIVTKRPEDDNKQVIHVYKKK